MTDTTASTIPTSDFLIRGSDYLKSKPGFKLVGRSEELDNVANVLMRKDNNNLIIFGQTGVGVSSILMGLQASKEDPNTPFDIVGKRFYYLDIDALFASGNMAEINEGFQKAMATLKSQPDTVLVIEDTKDFLDGVRNNGVNNIVNTLMREARLNPGLQIAFETRDSSIGELFKAHSDIAELFTPLEVREPSKAALEEIVAAAIPGLEEFHGVKISPEAVKMVMDLTVKYPGLTLNTAQPKRTTMILEGALTAYRHKMHSNPPAITAAEEALAEVEAALAGTGNLIADKSPGELEAMKIERSEALDAVRGEWKSLQENLRKLYDEQRIGEKRIREIDQEIEGIREQQKKDAEKAAAPTPGGEAVEVEAVPEDTNSLSNIFTSLRDNGMEGKTISNLQEERTKIAGMIEASAAKYKAMTTEVNKDLVLAAEHVLAEFSRLSGVPMNKLQQDETAKLMNLEETLGKRVFGQPEPVKALAKSVRRGRAGLKKANKPIGSFMFLGPSGVGKTELAKALAEALFGDERALQVYDMSEYMEKHAAAKLIGSPPGYEGYEAGGILTNNMRRQPYCVNVFDEVEKANKSVFDLFLQILDEGRLTDNHGIPSSFANSINILTSNVGAKYFLDETKTFEEAKELALKDLWDPGQDEHGNSKGFRPEFLNRFTGIFCFNRLGQPEIMMIAGKTMKELNSWVAEKGINVEMSQVDMAAMCEDHYKPHNGARGIIGYIETNITSDVADTLLSAPDTPGTVQVTYDKAAEKTIMEFKPADGKGTPANQNAKAEKTAKAAAPAA